jgi:hypothetical protein
MLGHVQHATQRSVERLRGETDTSYVFSPGCRALPGEPQAYFFFGLVDMAKSPRERFRLNLFFSVGTNSVFGKASVSRHRSFEFRAQARYILRALFPSRPGHGRADTGEDRVLDLLLACPQMLHDDPNALGAATVAEPKTSAYPIFTSLDGCA